MPFSKASRSIIRPNPEFEPGTLQEWGPPYTSRIQSVSVPGPSIVVYVRKCVEWVLSAGVQHSNLHPGTAWDLVDGTGPAGDIDRDALQFAHTCPPGLWEGLVR